MTVADALARLLRKQPLRAVRLGPALWRIERAPLMPAALPARILRQPKSNEIGPGDVIVTATKRNETIARAAIPLAVLDTAALALLGDLPDTGAVATALNGLTVTNLGSGRDRLFIRGIADSPFDGFGQSSVSVNIDEARATYDAPDPDLRNVDMAQIELLKGPQGPLYGTGALGGVFRLVPAKPDLARASGWVRLGASAMPSGELAGSIDTVANVPLVEDRLGLRLVAYRVGQSGWIDDVNGARAINHGQTSGGRADLRARTDGGWTVDLQAITQSSSARDSQYVEGGGTLTRKARIAEPQDTDFTLASVTASGPLGGVRVTAVASTAWQQLRATYDASYRAVVLGGTAPAAYVDDRQYRVTNGEIRIGGRAGRLDWLAGVSALSAGTNATGTSTAATGTAQVLLFTRGVTEAALFGEGTWHVTDALRGTLGLRVFRSEVADRREEQADSLATTHAVIRASPSATIAWQPQDRLLVFLRYASALRPGGIEAAAGSGSVANQYEADELTSFDVGTRWQVPTVGLTLDAGAFASNWSHVQADYLGANGLVTTRNAGDAENIGIDTTIGWRSGPHWSVSSGVLFQHARIKAGAAAALSPDRRLPVVPDANAHVEARYGFDLGRWRTEASVRGTYVGERRLSFDPGLDRRSKGMALASTALAATSGVWRMRLSVDNLTDSRADSFAFGNPFSITVADQRTPVRPRTFALSVLRDW